MSFVALLHGASAATYYIDQAGGDDANAGTSRTAPWRHAPGDGNASMRPASTALQPGDRIVFKGGAAYKGSIRLQYSGTADAPIIYDGNSDGTWGTGRAVITSFNELDDAGRWTAMRADAGLRHIIIRGLHFRDIGGYADEHPIWRTTNAVSRPPGGAGISFDNGGSQVTVDGCTFEEIGQWINAVPMSGPYSISGVGVHFRGGTDIVVSNCTFKRMRIGVSIKASTVTGGVVGPALVTGCDFTDHLVWGVDVAPQSHGVLMKDIAIDRCNFFNYSQYDSGNWKGYGEKPHRDGIFLRNAGMRGSWSNVVVRGCRFWDDAPGESRGGTASIYISEGPSASIYNCAFLNDPMAMGVIAIGFTAREGIPQRVFIANNTFAGGNRPIFVSAESSADEIILMNNAFYRRVKSINSGALNVVPEKVGSFISDYNLYFSDQDNTKWRAVYCGTFLTFGEWKSRGYDLHSYLGNPLFAKLDGPPSTWDLRPLQGSPLIGAGADLSAFFNADINVTPRTAPWTIGAVQINTSGNRRSTAPASSPGGLQLHVVNP